jgi:hypothetical protein
MSRNSPLPPQNYHQMHPQQQQPCPQGYENGWRGPPQLQIQPPLNVSSSSPSPQFYSPSQPSPYQQQQIYRPILQQQQPMYSPMYSQPRPQQQAQPQRPSLNQFGPAAAPQKISSNNFPSHNQLDAQLQQQQHMYNPINRRPDNQSMLFGKPRSGKIQPEAAIAPMPIIPSIEELTIYEMPGCQQLPPPKQQQQQQQQLQQQLAFRQQQPPPQQQQFSRPQSQQSNPIQLAPPKQQPQFTNRISPPPMLLSIQQPQQQQHHYQFQCT